MRQKKSFWAFLGRQLPEEPDVVAERIRKGMLLALSIHCDASSHSLGLRVKIARGIFELWYLRPDLMQAISASTGERIAQDVLRQITTLFQDHHPLAGHGRICAPTK